MITLENNLDLKSVALEHLGTAKKIEILKGWTTIVAGNGPPDLVEEQIDILKDQIASTDNMHECEKLQERITRLASGIAIIRVGGATEIEMIEKKHRIEEALEAVNSAQVEVIVTGGVSVLIDIA